MDTFLLHRNYTRQTSGTAVKGEATSFVNSAVRSCGFVNCAARDFFCSAGIVPVKVGNGSAGGLVNSTVKDYSHVVFT